MLTEWKKWLRDQFGVNPTRMTRERPPRVALYCGHAYHYGPNTQELVVVWGRDLNAPPMCEVYRKRIGVMVHWNWPKFTFNCRVRDGK